MTSSASIGPPQFYLHTVGVKHVEFYTTCVSIPRNMSSHSETKKKISSNFSWGFNLEWLEIEIDDPTKTTRLKPQATVFLGEKWQISVVWFYISSLIVFFPIYIMFSLGETPPPCFSAGNVCQPSQTSLMGNDEIDVNFK